jgi:Tellurite resistance protein TerB.
MFLNMLSNDEKELFLDVAIKAAEANGEIAKEEKEMLHAFAQEMKIESRSTTNKDISEILKAFTENSSKQSMRIVVFELIGILFADSEFDDFEKEFLSKVTDSFGISIETRDEMISEIKDYSENYNRICKTVL